MTSGSLAADRLTLVQLRLAVACFLIAILVGMLAALHYVPAFAPGMNELGATLPKMRPMHTTFASLWIFGAAIAVLYHYMAHSGGGLTEGDQRRFWFHTACWITAGAAILVTISSGIFSGREYVGFHWSISAVLLLGWFALAYNFLRRIRTNGFFGQPVYVWFWSIGLLFFIYTFVEGHAYLLPWVEQNPIRDLQIQWKSCGTLVGSFNFLVYGALIYMGERLTGDKQYAQSTLAFSLFGVGCLNSFTNYAHHTYHLPQSDMVKWIAFVVSMLEVIIFARLIWDLAKRVKQSSGTTSIAACYLGAAKWWTAGMLLSSLFLSVPTLNGLIHGTHVVTGHAMGTELGIDSMVLFGAVAFLLNEARGRVVEESLGCGRMRTHLLLMNCAMVALVGWLTVEGAAHGIARWQGEPPPEWITAGFFVFPVAGGVLGLTFLYLFARWVPFLGRDRSVGELVGNSESSGSSVA